MQIYVLEESKSKRLFIFFLININRDFKKNKKIQSIFLLESRKLCGYSFIPIRSIQFFIYFLKLLGSK
jgi:hypothetical protein